MMVAAERELVNICKVLLFAPRISVSCQYVQCCLRASDNEGELFTMLDAKTGTDLGMVTAKDLLEGMFQAFSAKDLPQVMSYFANDAVFCDPHYPQQHMVGKEAIAQGMAWSMGKLN